MRENKFRAWVKELSVLANVVAINFEVGKVVLDIETEGTYWWHTSTFDLKDVVLMQYTGLKDADGKEIYEGDVVKEDFADEYKVEYVEEYAGFLPFVNDGGCGCCSYIPTYLPHECKVIGNIYENPDLLKGGE